MERVRWEGLQKVSRSVVVASRQGAAVAAGADRLAARLGQILGVPVVIEARSVGGVEAGPGPWIAVTLSPHARVLVDPVIALHAVALALGDDRPELPAARRSTLAERGVLGYLAAALLVAGNVESVEDVDEVVAPQAPIALTLRLRIGASIGRLALVLPETSRPPLAFAQAEGGLARLAGVRVPARILAGRVRVSVQELAALAPRDVVIVSARPATRWLALGRGACAARIDESLVVTAPYDEGAPPMDDKLAADLPVELSCELARLTLSVKEALALAPGAVVPLGRKLDAHVSLVAGERVVARGELVDVEGELGVRILELG